MIKFNRKTGDITHNYTQEQIEELQETVVRHGGNLFLEEEEEHDNEN